MTTLLPIFESLLHEFPGLAYRCLNDESWTMQYVSSGARELTGYAPEYFMGQSAHAFQEIIHVDDRPRLHEEVDRALAASSGFEVEYRIVTADGSIKRVSERGNAIRDEQGNVLALQGFITDVTVARETQRALDEVTERFRWIAQATNDNIWDWDLRTNQLWHGPDMGNLFGLPANDSRPGLTCWSDLVHPEDKEWVLDSLHASTRGDEREWSAEYRMQRKDGSYAEVLDRAFIVRDTDGAPLRMVGGISDLSESKRSRHHMEQLNRAVRILSQCSQRLVRAADEESLLGDICELIVETGGYGAVLVSQVEQGREQGQGHALELASGYCPRLKHIGFDALTSASYARDLDLAALALESAGPVVCNDLSKERIAPAAQEVLRERGHHSAICLRFEHEQRKLGVISIYSGALAPFDAEEIQLLQTLADNIAFGIANLRSRAGAELAVSKLAFYDQLTGLPNRHLFEKQLRQFLDGGAGQAAEGALLWIDLDHLKSVNDTRGHDVGDALLRHTSTRILAAIGDANSAARFGGDEFVVLVQNLRGSPETAVCIAQRILASLSEPLDVDGYVHSGSASIGLTYFRCGQDAAAEILKRADIAMYEAKAAGRNTLRLFDRQMQKSIDMRAQLESDLRRALQDDGLHLAYQPQVSDSGEVTGVEALLRWTHSVYGPVSPAEFIPIAETSGLILSCGAWVLNEACLQLKRWESHPAARVLSIAVNISAKELLHPGFVGQVMKTLKQTGADPRKLKLELTESSLVTDTDATVAKMKTLKSVGIGFSLDDFGTGFSSLSYLNRLPLDQLKIDRSFVLDVNKDTNAAVITRSIIALGHSLGLEIVAEGVETTAQQRFLAMHGCGRYQGFLFSRPIAIGEFEEYLQRSVQRGKDVLLSV